MESLLICLIVTILVIHSGNASLTISVDTNPIKPGNDVTLTCVSDQGVVTFVWQHNSRVVALGILIHDSTRFMVANTGTQSVLTIIGFENDLDGTWECLNFGTESTSVSLSVDGASCLQTEGEPCDTKLELTDWHRSIRYKTQSGDVLISDYFFNDGWYKLMTEGQRTDITMPTSNPAEFQCGTRYPIWINGTYPEVDDTINVVKGCVNILDEPCRYELQLCIKACGNAEERYYVHYLVETPGSNMGYCTDSLLPCSNGTSSVTGFPPCAGNFPVLEGKPVLSFKEEPTGVSAHCDYSMLWSGEDEEVIDFFVRWFIDGEYVTDGPRLSKISDEFDCGTGPPHQCILNRRAGSNIQCEVSSKFEDQDVYSQGIKSNLLYAGLIVLPNNTIEFVGESEDGETFEVTSTIPIVCRQGNGVCDTRISINVDLNGENDAVADACSRFVEYQSPASFNIKAARDGYNDGDVANYVKFKADVTSLIPLSRIWEELSTNLPTIKVVTKDVEIGKTCYGSGDPHYRTFDGWYYHIYQPGDYVFYQHRTLPIKIQSRVASCGNVACNCGVAVQVGHTHLIVDRCNNAGDYYVTYKTTHNGQIQKEIRKPENTRVTTAEIFRNGEKTPGTVLQYKNGNFEIYLPTGSVLTITLFWSHFISLALTASSDDFNSIDGLCGNFDEDPSNDGQYGPAGATTYDCSQPVDCEPAIYNSVPSKKFYESWRVDEEKNIFMGFLNVDPDKDFKIERYCTCDDDFVNCEYCNARTDDDPNLSCVDDNRRRREIVEEDPDDLVGTYEFGTQSENDQEFEPYVPGFPTASGLTEENTKRLCNETLVNSTTYHLCLNAINNGSVTVDDIIEGCIVDVKVSDDVSLARQVISDLQIRCEVVLTKNPMYWEESENGTIAPPTALLGQLCVNECNDKGECVNGTCECNEGLGGSDCSISLAEPPLVFSVLGDGLCDIRNRPCRSAKIYGEYFAETGNITCHIQNINVSDNGITALPTISTVAGIFRTPQEVKCPLPEPAVQPSLPGEGIVSSGYLISISNDGELKNEDMVVLIVYDSVCQVCNASEGECNLKNNSCNINGHCYASFDVNINDCCQQCLPEISIDNWSVRQEDMAPTVLTSNPYPAIHQKQLNFTFDTEDPEQCSLTFSMTSKFENATISPDGEFVWLPSSNQESMFNITVHDKCGFSATVLFAVNICKCENGEECAFVNGSSLYECVCPGQLDGVLCGKETLETVTSTNVITSDNAGTVTDIVTEMITKLEIISVGTSRTEETTADSAPTGHSTVTTLATTFNNNLSSNAQPHEYNSEGTIIIVESTSDNAETVTDVVTELITEQEIMSLGASQTEESADSAPTGHSTVTTLPTTYNNNLSSYPQTHEYNSEGTTIIVESTSKETPIGSSISSLTNISQNPWVSSIKSTMISQNNRLSTYQTTEEPPKEVQCSKTCKNGRCKWHDEMQICVCNDGYILESKEDDVCEDVNECTSNVCTGDGEICKNLPGSYECTCTVAWEQQNSNCIRADSWKGSFRAGMWKNGLVLNYELVEYPESESYNEVYDTFKKLLTTIYESNSDFIRVEIVGFGKGSIIVNYNVIFGADSKLTEEILKATLEEGLNSQANFTVDKDSIQYSDVEECSSGDKNDCSANAICYEIWGSFTCECLDGYEDTSRSTYGPGRECTLICNCENGGNCTHRGTPESVTCSCLDGYIGDRCEIKESFFNWITDNAIIMYFCAAIVLIILLFCCCYICRGRSTNQKPSVVLTGQSLLSDPAQGQGRDPFHKWHPYLKEEKDNPIYKDSPPETLTKAPSIESDNDSRMEHLVQIMKEDKFKNLLQGKIGVQPRLSNSDGNSLRSTSWLYEDGNDFPECSPASSPTFIRPYVASGNEALELMSVHQAVNMKI